MDKGVNKLLFQLSWDNSIAVQNEAVNQLVSYVDLDLTLLLQPLNKSYWDNAARVLFLKGYPIIKSIIPQLLEWIQDLNWPGATIIFELLQSVPKPLLLSYIESSIKKAKLDNDEDWLINLNLLLN